MCFGERGVRESLVLHRLRISPCERVEEQWCVRRGEVLDVQTKLYLD
jgi:hypothetical protein